MRSLAPRVDRLEARDTLVNGVGKFPRKLVILGEGSTVPDDADEVIWLIGVDPAPRMAELARLRGES